MITITIVPYYNNDMIIRKVQIALRAVLVVVLICFQLTTVSGSQVYDNNSRELLSFYHQCKTVPTDYNILEKNITLQNGKEKKGICLWTKAVI